MSSNIKIVKCQKPFIPGTKPAIGNAEVLISTGIPSLDHFIGGGLPVGSIFLVEEDAYNKYAKVVLKYFMAEGIVNSHPLFVASQDSKPSQILFELPAVEEEHSKLQENSTKPGEMKIAWRYQNMKIFQSSPGDTSKFGHYYDLSKKMNKEIVEKANVQLWDGEKINCDHGIFKNNAYMDLLLKIEKTIMDNKLSFSLPIVNKNILRIAINSLGSRLWLNDTEENTQQDLLKFLYMLRALLRESSAVATITIPALNYDDDSTGIVQRIEHLSDIVIGLESFADSSRETNPLFKDYHGLLHIKKLSALNTLLNQDSLFSDLAFKLRRKNFFIKILHLPPELGDTSQREQDETATSGCGGTSTKHKLAF